jgi:predicted AAA+ superfamily ATPase
MAKLPWTPWHQVVQLRDDLKTGDLALHQFAADLYEVTMQSGKRPVYEEPEHFFALTFPTHNLRNLVRDVCLRVAGKSDKAVRQVELTYGGGKTHTLITLFHLVNDPTNLPAGGEGVRAGYRRNAHGGAGGGAVLRQTGR